MDAILSTRNNTIKSSKAQMEVWKSYDDLRELKDSNIMTLIASER